MSNDKLKRKAAAKKAERKQKVVPYDPKDPRQLKLMLVPSDEHPLQNKVRQ
jgi:hypothetical protein